MKTTKKILTCLLAGALTVLGGLTSGLAQPVRVHAAEGTTSSPATSGDTITLRISNWEEYIDLGEWGEDEVIDLESGDIFGENSLIDDFAAWYKETYGKKVVVEYSNFGTNEDLYNMLTLGDTYDLVCPSEYMFMKLMSENQLVPLSDAFFDESDSNNYYTKGVSPYLKDIFETSEINGEAWSKYAAGYLWGITGFVYNPERMTEEQASTWQLITNPEFKRQVTIKDNVRDSYFAAVGAMNAEQLTSEVFRQSPDYAAKLEDLMNNTSQEEINKVQAYLQEAKDNIYSFETDSGKADMITGKVLANYQWSGDAIYTMYQADEDGVQLDFAVPEESTNIYFDGWVMLKSGINGDAEKQHAAEAFINFLSRPDNAIRNMYYIGYTSVIAGGEDSRVLEYLDWNYGAGEDEEETEEYDTSYFFTGDMETSHPDYVLTVPAEQTGRQLSAQYPSLEVMERASIMRYFTPEQNAAINRMWVNVRCYNIENMPIWGWGIFAAVMALFVWQAVKKIKHKFRQE